MKYVLSFTASLILFLICSCAPTTKLMTYNIHSCIGMDGKLDPVRIADVIRDTGAETVAMQEVDKLTERIGYVDQSAVIAKELNYHYLFGKAINRSKGDYGNALLSRYPLEQIDNFEIPTLGEPRRVLVAKVNAPVPYYVLATHFTYQTEADKVRVECARIIKAYLDKHPQYRPVFLMGDLNAAPERESIQTLRDSGFRVFNDARPKMLSFPARKPRILLDYIAEYPANSVKFKSVCVVNEAVASDHRPVLVKVILPENKGKK